MQILPNQVMGYDRAITIFSPDGRLLQVEYAKKAVSQGAMTLGLVYNEGILLIADRRISDKLVVPESIKKISIIDDHIVFTFSGLTPDARVIIKKSRVFAQQHKLTYGEEIDVEGVIKYISDTEQAYTQFGGIRPMGISFLIAGKDKKGKQLYVTEPSGIYAKYLAKAIGLNSEDANTILDKKYKPNMKKDDALNLAINIFKEVLGKEFGFERLEASVVTEKGIEKLDLRK